MEIVEADRHASRTKHSLEPLVKICVSRVLTIENLMNRIYICGSVLNHYKIDRLLKRIVTADENCIIYCNAKCGRW